MEESLIDAKQACEMLTCTERTLYNWVKRGLLPVVSRATTGERAFNYWDVIKLVGVKGRNEKNKRKALDIRRDQSIMNEIAAEVENDS